MVKRQQITDWGHRLVNSKYAAMRANKVMAEDAVNLGKRSGAGSGPKGIKTDGREDVKMRATADTLKRDVCAEGRDGTGTGGRT